MAAAAAAATIAATPQRPDTQTIAGQGVPDRSLLVYAGCGIEPSKKTELVFNDLWAMVLDRRDGKGEWVNLTTRGAVPRPQSGYVACVFWTAFGPLFAALFGVVAGPSYGPLLTPPPPPPPPIALRRHKAEVVGETLVVVGGIPATPFSLPKADQGLTTTLATITRCTCAARPTPRDSQIPPFLLVPPVAGFTAISLTPSFPLPRTHVHTPQ